MHVLLHTIMAYDHCHTSNTPCDIRWTPSWQKLNNTQFFAIQLPDFELHLKFEPILIPSILKQL